MFVLAVNAELNRPSLISRSIWPRGDRLMPPACNMPSTSATSDSAVMNK